MHRSAIRLLGVLLLSSACNEALMEPVQMGSIALSLSSDIEVVAPTKTAGSVDCSDYIVTVTGVRSTGEQYSKEYIYGQMTEGENIPFGSYMVAAQNCTEARATEGFGCARYYGSSDEFQIASQTAVPVQVRCTMVNAKASLTLDQSFLEDFDDISVILKVTYQDGEETKTREVSLPLDDEHPSCGQEVYFNVPAEGGNLIYVVTATVCKGTDQQRELTYTNSSSPMILSPAKWAKITIRSNHNGSIGGPDISLDDMGNNSFSAIIDPDTGTEIIEGEMNLPRIYVDTSMGAVTLIDCVLDVN